MNRIRLIVIILISIIAVGFATAQSPHRGTTARVPAATPAATPERDPPTVQPAPASTVLCCGAVFSYVSGQTQKPPQQQPQPDDVLRINVELVQTNVMVFDKQGHFTKGLKQEQFEFVVDGKPQPISFFEEVRAGSAREQAVLQGGGNKTTAQTTESSINTNRGRVIVFFVDDLHLSLDSLGRTRQMLARFVDTEMTENDRVAIASTSGDIGFLQQFTDNKSVLSAAAGRLTQHAYNVHEASGDQTPMTEYIALSIERKEDPGVVNFYIDQCLNAAFPLKYTRQACETEVTNRARSILQQASSVTVNTYRALEGLIRTQMQFPGRKLIFFVSDGFLLDTGPRNADPRERITHITDAALKAGAVIYTIDARGLFSGQLDATNNVPVDQKNRLGNVSAREIPATQDALNALAADTGGRALRNQSYFDRWVSGILDETSNYYLLAWRPNNLEQAGTDFKNILVRVSGHPELTVRLPRGFLNIKAASTQPPANAVKVQAQSHQELQQALTSANPKHEIPTLLSLVFLDTPEHGPVLTASVRVSNEALSYEMSEGKQTAAVDVVGVVLNDKGKPAGTFQTRLKISPPASGNTDQNNSATIYNARVPLAPGLYQVRVASRDNRNGEVGSAQQWLQIPDLALHRLSLSSLLLGVQSVEVKEAKDGPAPAPQVQFNVDHHFARSSHLGFMAFVYNAARAADGKSLPVVSIQARILRMGQPILTTPVRPVTVAPDDLARIFCGGEIQLDSVPPGQYILEVTVTDQIAKTSASQQTKITVE